MLKILIYKQKLRGKNKKGIPLKIDIFKGNAIEVSTQSRDRTGTPCGIGV